MDKGCENDLFDLFHYECFETIPSSIIFDRSHWLAVKFIGVYINHGAPKLFVTLHWNSAVPWPLISGAVSTYLQTNCWSDWSQIWWGNSLCSPPLPETTMINLYYIFILLMERRYFVPDIISAKNFHFIDKNDVIFFGSKTRRRNGKYVRVLSSIILYFYLHETWHNKPSLVYTKYHGYELC